MRWDKVKGFNYLYTARPGSTRKVMSPLSCLPPDLNGVDIQPQARCHWYGTDLAFEWNGDCGGKRRDWQEGLGERGKYCQTPCHCTHMWTRWLPGNVWLIRARLLHVSDPQGWWRDSVPWEDLSFKEQWNNVALDLMMELTDCFCSSTYLIVNFANKCAVQWMQVEKGIGGL